MSAKTRTVKTVIKDQNLVDMFNQMLNGEGDAKIVVDKLQKFKSAVGVIVKVTNDFSTGPFSKHFSEYKEWAEEIGKWSAYCGELLALTGEDSKVWSQIKEHNQTKQIILASKELVAYEAFLDVKDGEKMTDRWLVTLPGLSFVPFKFTKLDLKHIWDNERTTPAIKNYCLATIRILFRRSKEVYTLVTSPDVDTKRLSVAILGSIGKVKSLPQLNRCGKAFNKILESVDLLETNFTDYYRDMVSSKNPNTIIENFVMDVSKGPGMDAELMRQFRVIFTFYKKQASEKVKDPKMQKLFESLGEKINLIESNPRPKVEESDADGESIEAKAKKATSK